MGKLAVMLCVLFFPAISNATPSIGNVGGKFSHGMYITITGSEFGTKSPANPIIWADFEEGRGAANSSLSKGVVVNSSNPYVINTTNSAHARSKYNIRGMANTKGAKTISSLDAIFPSAGSYYYFVRRKFPAGMWGYVSNAKYFWAYATDQEGPIRTVMDYQNFSNPRDPNYVNQGMATIHSGGSGVGGRTKGLPDSGEWTTWEFQEKKSDIDVSNGIIKWWVDSKLVRSSKDVLSRTSTYPSAGYSRFVFQNFWTESVPGATWTPNEYDYIDDLYLDSTWARVMIGNASTFDVCTRREPLIPTAWSNTSITAYFNQGSFSNGQSAYLFIVDSDGNASPGKAITIGDAFDPILPDNNPTPPLKNPNSPLNVIIK